MGTIGYKTEQNMGKKYESKHSQSSIESNVTKEIVNLNLIFKKKRTKRLSTFLLQD